MFRKDFLHLAEEHDLLVISDEIYDKLLYDGKMFTPFRLTTGNERPDHHDQWRLQDLRHDRACESGTWRAPAQKWSKPLAISKVSQPPTRTIPGRPLPWKHSPGPQDEVARMRDIFQKRRELHDRRSQCNRGAVRGQSGWSLLCLCKHSHLCRIQGCGKLDRLRNVPAGTPSRRMRARRDRSARRIIFASPLPPMRK